MTHALPAFTSPPALNHIYHCDAITLARALPDNFINCVVTSPPYLWQRKYGVTGEWGSEPTLAEYIHNLVMLFREIRRALRPDGVVWLNLGDKYANDGKWGGSTGGKHVSELHGNTFGREKVQTGFKPKDLMLIPARVAIALQDDGWYVRQDNIWFKPNPLPESVKDRPTRAHEYVFMLTKSPTYWYDPEPVKTPVKPTSIKRRGRPVHTDHKNVNGAPGQTVHSMFAPRVNAHRNDSAGSKSRDSFNEKYENRAIPMANLRSVWKISPVGFKEAHFATFPPRIPEIAILTSCPPYMCPQCGKPWIRCTEKTFHLDRRPEIAVRGSNGQKPMDASNNWQGVLRGTNSTETLGWSQVCSCHPGLVPVPGIVYDPFMGSGTTALVALEHGRHYIGSELNAEYVQMARRRIAVAQTPGLDDFFEALTIWATQFDDLPLFQQAEL